MKKPNNNNSSWQDILWDIIEWVIPIGGIGGFVLYKITGFSLFKWIAIISIAPIALVFLGLIVGFCNSFIIYCFLCLIPGRSKKVTLPFFEDKDDQLPWWGAVIWLVVIFAFLSQTIPVVLHNIGAKLGIINGKVVSIASNIDQTTIWGMFTAWVVGPRTLMNSIVSWSLIAFGIGILTAVGWAAKKLWQLSRGK